MSKRVSAPNRFWVIVKPSAGGAVVDKCDTEGETEMVIPDDCVAVSVPSQSALAQESVDKAASPFYEERPDGEGYSYIGPT